MPRGDAYAVEMTTSSEPSASRNPHAWITLAHLLRPQGRKGEILAELFTDFPERFDDRTRVFLAGPGFTGSESEARAIAVTSYWLPVGRNHGRVVLGFEGIDSIDKAETLGGLDVLVPASERVELEDDAEYVSDLIGCVVYDGAIKVGEVTDVEFPTTSDGARRLADAAPLLSVLTDAGDEVLIPYVQTFLVAVLPEEKRIEMALPVGLVDVNRSESR
jgi:16S rRNA processing protein RimM